jgi:predicted AAA+ superfamily ATPase
MRYITRTLERAFLNAGSEYPALLLTGPRQSGKTTMLQRLAEQEGRQRGYISLDDYDALLMAQNDPVMFFHTYKPPVLIDEIQYAPNLFREIKRLVDQRQTDNAGAFWLTGSQQFRLMEGVQESLAGRVALFHLSPLSQQEAYPTFSPAPFALDYDMLLERQKTTPPLTAPEVYERILRGSMPGLVGGRFHDRDTFYLSYIRTYLERDIRDMSGELDSLKFFTFLRAAAARTAQLLNYKSIADDAEIDQETAKAWLRLLETLGIIFFIRPYSSNALKRVIKTPKLYFYDTGLTAYLCKWKSAETLMSGAMNGAFLENYCVAEILKSFEHACKEPSLYLYRDKDQREIDLLIEGDGMFCPVELKKTASPSRNLIDVFSVLEHGTLERGKGAIVCMAEHLSAFNQNNFVVPVALL